MSIFTELEQEGEITEEEAIDQEFEKNKSAIEAIEDTEGYKLIVDYCQIMTTTYTERLKICKKDDFERIQAQVNACESLLEQIKI